jgi:hypothetical protein
MKHAVSITTYLIMAGLFRLSTQVILFSLLGYLWASLIWLGPPPWFSRCPLCKTGEIKTWTAGKDKTYCTNPRCPPKKQKIEHEVL